MYGRRQVATYTGMYGVKHAGGSVGVAMSTCNHKEICGYIRVTGWLTAFMHAHRYAGTYPDACIQTCADVHIAMQERTPLQADAHNYREENINT